MTILCSMFDVYAVLFFCLFVRAATADDKPSLFTELGFKGKQTVSEEIYEESVRRESLTNRIGKFMLATDQACRKRAEQLGKSPNQIGSLAGAWLEFSVLVALHDRKLTPAYYQAELRQVADAIYDVMVWTKEHGPVVLSCKTSLRERYKQADLEAIELRQVYPASKSFLITLDADKNHVATCRQKIVAKEIKGLDAIYDETNVEELFAWLSKQTVIAAPDGKFKKARPIR